MSRQAAERLFERISAAKAADALTPVTVIVPNHYAGLWLRRELAQRSYVNVRFSVLGQLAESLSTLRGSLQCCEATVFFNAVADSLEPPPVRAWVKLRSRSQWMRAS